MKIKITPQKASYLVRAILEFWFFFIRVKEIRVPEATLPYLEKKGGFLLAGWHNQILSLTLHVSHWLQKKKDVWTTPLVSQSKDGEFIFETFKRFEMHSVRGSSTRGGAAGLKALLKEIKNNKVPIFTPDGPVGPLYKVKPGVIQTASMTGLPIVAFHCKFDRYWQVKSWDKHIFPKFFAKQTVEYSEPLFVPKGISEEEIEVYAQKLEEIMLAQVNSPEPLL